MSGVVVLIEKATATVTSSHTSPHYCPERIHHPIHHSHTSTMPNVVAHGGISAGNVNGNTVEYNIDGGGSKTEVPNIEDKDRSRGWVQLNSNNGSVLAYYLIDEDTVILLRKPNLENYLEQLPDDRALADVSLPGSHESASLYGGFISICQTVNVEQQLRDGIRFFDIRLKAQVGEVRCYHGVQNENSTLQEQLGWITNFLKAHPRETVVVSVKQEDEDADDFAKLVYDAFNAEPNLWRYDETLPTLGDARGRGVLFTRFSRKNDGEFPNGLGIHPDTWPDNRHEGFDWNCNGIPFRIHDWYGLDGPQQVGAKADAVTNFLNSTTDVRESGNGNNHPYSLAFASASKFPATTPAVVAKGDDAGGLGGVVSQGAAFFANLTGGAGASAPTTAGEGVNSRLTRWLLQRARDGKRPRATVMLDFYQEAGSGDAGVAGLLAAMNFMNND